MWNSHKKSEQSNSLVCLDDEDDLGSSDSDYSETDDQWPELQLGSLAKSLAKKLESKYDAARMVAEHWPLLREWVSGAVLVPTSF